jgi:hypothetical protein
MAPTAPGCLRGGRYALLKPLGEGSQGETFEAVDKREGRLVAVKRFRVGSARAWKDVELAEREATTLASLDHPLLPKYVEHFEEDGALVLVMERIEGESLAALRKSGHRFSVPEIERLLRDASSALTYLHGRAPPVVHRDLKPGNVIKRPDGSFAFVDFGAVRQRLEPAGGSTVVGTFGYMAPEQFQGRASAASDVYGIGATALSLLTGTEPEDLPHRGLAIDVARAVPESTPRSLVRTLEAMLEPDPERRAATVAAALARGAEVRASRPPAARPVREALPDAEGEAVAGGFVAWLVQLLRFLGALLQGRGLRARTRDPELPRARATRDDVLRGVRVVSPEQAQADAMRRVRMTQAEAEAWADEVATREAEQWEPPEAWQEEDRKNEEKRRRR